MMSTLRHQACPAEWIHIEHQMLSVDLWTFAMWEHKNLIYVLSNVC